MILSEYTTVDFKIYIIKIARFHPTVLINIIYVLPILRTRWI